MEDFWKVVRNSKEVTAEKEEESAMKKNRKRRILEKILLLGTAMCVSNPVYAREVARPSVNGALQVRDGRLTDEQGKPVQLKGISTHGLAWFPEYVNESVFAELSNDWQVDVMRLAMYTAENGGYCTDGDQETLKDLIQKGVEYTEKNDMYAIIDWHILSDLNPLVYEEKAIAFFAEVSEKYGDYQHVLYEICNEPNGGTSWADIKTYAEAVIPVIRENDPDAVILVGTPNWSQYVDEAAADPITEYENIMYTLHFYAATHKEDLRERLKAAVEQKLPVFVSEYSICDASGNGALDLAQAEEWRNLLDEYQISCVNWNLSNKAESSALIKSDCSKTSGFTAEDLSPAGVWLYEMLINDVNDGAEVDNGLDSYDQHAHASESEQENGENVQTSESEFEKEAAKADSECPLSAADEDNFGKKPGENASITAEASVTNQWESDGRHYYQYNLTLQNHSEEAVSGWNVTLEFNEKLELSDGWNGDYSVLNETQLSIQAKDYNKDIAASAAASDIGFIVSSEGQLELIAVSIN